MKQKAKFFDLKLPDKVFGIEKYFLTLFLPPLGVLILFLVSLNLVFIPKMDDIATVKSKISSVNISTSKITDQNKYLESIDQEELQRNTEYLNNAVLKNKQSYLLVGIVRSVANKFDYQVKSFSLVPGELKDDGGSTKGSSAELDNMVRMPVNLTLTGPKDKALDLVSALEKTLPILFIDRFETRTNGENLQLTLTVYSYYINEETNLNTDNISLSDLILSSEESALVDKISTFTKIEENQASVGTTEFQQYTRENPFSI